MFKNGSLALFSAAAFVWAAETNPPPPSSPPPLQLDDIPPIVVDQNGAATATLTLRFNGKHTQPLRLWLPDFQHAPPNGKPYSIDTTAVLTPVNPAEKGVLDGTATIPETMKSLTFKVAITGLWESGESTATLRNGEVEIDPGKPLKALRIPQVHNVRLEAPTSATPEVLVSYGTELPVLRALFTPRKPTVRIINSDPLTHRFEAVLRINGESKPLSQAVVVPPSGSTLIDFSSVAPTPSALTAGTIKDGMASAELVLTPAFGAAAVPAQPPKILPLAFRLRFWRDGIQEFVNVACIFLLLALGGIVSIWVNCGMPNTSRALAVRRRLTGMKTRIAGIGDDIDSRWRVLLSARRVWLKKQLYDTLWVFPSFAAVLEKMVKEVDMVEAWVECTYNVSLVMQEARQQRQKGFPPTVLTWIEDRCKTALEPMESSFTTAEEIQKMRLNVAEACRLLAAVVNRSPLPELEQEIKAREERLRADGAALLQAFPTEFNQLIRQVTAQDAAKPVPVEAYIDRDTASAKLDLLSEFRGLVERMTPAVLAQQVGGSPVQSDTPSPTLERMRKHRERLMEFLRPESLDSLRQADLFLLEMKQDIYTDALKAEMEKKPPALSISVQSAEIEPKMPVRLSLRFHKAVLEGAAACREWKCEWNFGDGTPAECGWDVFHAFSAAGKFAIVVTIKDLSSGSVVATLPAREIEVLAPGPQTSNPVKRFWKWLAPETLLESARLMLVLVVAVVGLLAAAAKQVESMTLLQAAGAVFALGFGADTFKNMVTQKGSSQESASQGARP